MARPRKPTAALKLAGAFEKDPQREKARANEPVVTTPCGAPPNEMPSDAAAIWNELTQHGFWLTAADRLMLEIACRLFANFRSGSLDSGGVSKLITSLSKLGFTPTDRSKVGAPGAKEEEADEYADFR
jgi:hypothetical protein